MGSRHIVTMDIYRGHDVPIACLGFRMAVAAAQAEK